MSRYVEPVKDELEENVLEVSTQFNTANPSNPSSHVEPKTASQPPKKPPSPPARPATAGNPDADNGASKNGERNGAEKSLADGSRYLKAYDEIKRQQDSQPPTPSKPSYQDKLKLPICFGSIFMLILAVIMLICRLV